MLQIEESIAKHRFCEQEILDALEHFERNLEVHGTLEGDGKGAEAGFYKETKESIEGLAEELGPGREKDAIDMLKKELEREEGMEELLGGYTQGVVLAYLEWKKGEEERI
ncbi:hypothetical protein HYALB_00004775 [Hymenoscyphus albidus]|uniref:Uncharacterized protein n=1 Tax=Hymenoscyphus albidus TaxID=595503 RepID=A0A9N9LLU0_9HELO|nr:hypothetical protein HYALB_00004775 [Hymenoscyphus albidus]